MSYEELLPLVEERVPRGRPVVLVAESFSGPLALRYAAAHPGWVRAVVLCASFISSPVPRWVSHLVFDGLFRMPMPSPAVRLLLVGWDAPRSLVELVRRVIQRVRPGVLAYRVRQVMELDCQDALARCNAPVLYLRAGHDRIVGTGCARRIVAAGRNVTVRRVDGPHLLLQAEAHAAWGVVEEFLGAGVEIGARTP